MDLSTTYLGFKLPHPLIPGASPLVDNLDTVRELEDAGAPMIVMHSLFEEQITAEEVATAAAVDYPSESYAEALSYLPAPDTYKLGPDEYLEQIRKIKAAVGVPVVGSLNGTTPGGWLEYAGLIEEAGADALELNLYEVAADLEQTGAEVERRALEVVQAVKGTVRIPVAVKLSPFYSSIANFACQLDQLGADGLVLFNRFYQPDLDLENLEVIRVNLSARDELLLRLRWLAMLSGRVNCSLAATGGVHLATDAIKTIMTGAHAVQVVSALLRHGPAYLGWLRKAVAEWMEVNEYESVQQMTGSMGLLRCPNPSAYERANYVKILQSWTTY